jgi:hypothetical protein
MVLPVSIEPCRPEVVRRPGRRPKWENNSKINLNGTAYKNE